MPSHREIQFGPDYYARPVSSLLAAYCRGPDHPAKLRILQWMEKTLGEKRIVAGTKYGFEMAVDKADLIQRHLLYERVWEPAVSELLFNELTADDVFFDIGANVGYFTCLALKKRIRQVVAFEPDPHTREILQLNLKLNDFMRLQVKVVPKALGNLRERRNFFRSHVSNTGQSGFTSTKVVSTFEVDVERLDRLIEAEQLPMPSVLKIDVEGWEDEVIKGAESLFGTNAPRLIIFETDCCVNGQIANHSIESIFLKEGYNISPLDRLDAKGNYLARRK